MFYVRLLTSIKVANIGEKLKLKSAMFTNFIHPMKSQRKHFIVYFNILKIYYGI